MKSIRCLFLENADQLEDLLEKFDEQGFLYWIDGETEPNGGLMIKRHKQGNKVSFDRKYLDMPTSITRTEDRLLSGSLVVVPKRVKTQSFVWTRLGTECSTKSGRVAVSTGL